MSETVSFYERCFAELTHLQELNVHVIRIRLNPKAFHGLDSVEVLNFANSSGLWNEELTLEVLAPQIFPNVNHVN
mgnify:CR=1 FL=1